MGTKQWKEKDTRNTYEKHLGISFRKREGSGVKALPYLRFSLPLEPIQTLSRETSLAVNSYTQVKAGLYPWAYSAG